MIFAYENHYECAALGGSGNHAQLLLTRVPGDRDGRSAWMQTVAKHPEISIVLAQSIGLQVISLEQPFACLFHTECMATLTQGRNEDVVYHDPMGGFGRARFFTLPEVRAAIATRIPARPSPIAHVPWRIRMLHEAGMLKLLEVAVPEPPLPCSEHVRIARDGFKYLIECRWWLDPNEPVPFTRSFAASWCGLTDSTKARVAIDKLASLGIITKVGELPTGRQNPTYLYLPGTGTPVVR